MIFNEFLMERRKSYDASPILLLLLIYTLIVIIILSIIIIILIFSYIQEMLYFFRIRAPIYICAPYEYCIKWLRASDVYTLFVYYFILYTSYKIRIIITLIMYLFIYHHRVMLDVYTYTYIYFIFWWLASFSHFTTHYPGIIMIIIIKNMYIQYTYNIMQ